MVKSFILWILVMKKALLMIIACGLVVSAFSVAQLASEGQWTEDSCAQSQAACKVRMQASPGCRQLSGCNCISLGIQLNTNVPGIGKCIKYTGDNAGSAYDGDSTTVTPINAFPYLISRMIGLVTSALLVVGVIMIIAGGVLMTMGGLDSKNVGKGKEMILKVGAAIALLGLSGVLLKLINPNFFM